jgi:hypothetical protein
VRVPALDKVAFVLSVALLALLYGVLAESMGLFPSGLLRQAARQALASPLFAGTAARMKPQWVEPRVYDWDGVGETHPERMQPGLTLVTSAWESSDGWAPAIRLYDAAGSVLHEWPVRPTAIFDDTVASPSGVLSLEDLQGVYLFPDGDVLVNIEYVGVARLDACGQVLWWRSARSYHHSMARADDGTFWIPGVLRDRPAASPAYPAGYPGLSGPVHHDQVVQLSAEGEVLGALNVLDLLYDNGLQRYIPHAQLDHTLVDPYDTDVTHLNDIEPLSAEMADEYPLFEAGDLVVSLRQQHLVFVFDPDTRMVKWHAHSPFIHQHDPDFIGGGWIGVFDNNHDGTERGTMLGGSRIVLLQPHTDSVRVVFPTPRSAPLYTDVRGKWQLLENGNLLLTEAAAGRVVEVAPDGETVWEWVQAPSSATTVPAVTEATRVDLTPEEVAAWPCPTGPELSP